MRAVLSRIGTAAVLTDRLCATEVAEACLQGTEPVTGEAAALGAKAPLNKQPRRGPS